MDQELLTLQSDPAEIRRIHEQHLPFGPHTSRQKHPSETLLTQYAYVTLHDSDLKTPLWSAYELTRAGLQIGKSGRRANCWRADPRLAPQYRATLSDYREPVFDRGHLTPDSDFRFDRWRQLNTDLLTNVAPQYAAFNRQIWVAVERLTRDWAATHGRVLVVSGPAFDRDEDGQRDLDHDATRMTSRGGGTRVAVPSHFYRIVWRQDGRIWRSISLLLPHTSTRIDSSELDRVIQEAVVPISTVEAATGLRFHPRASRSRVMESSTISEWND